MSSAAARSLRFLTSAQVIRIHQGFITASQPSQPAMLESAINSPMSIQHYEGQQDIFQLAGTLAERIMNNHAFQDGNKRTALFAADMFLKMNGFYLQETPMANDAVDELARAHVAVTTKQWDAKQFGRYYESIATRITSSTPEIMGYRDNATEY